MLKQDILTPPRDLGYKFSNWTGKAVAQHIFQKFQKLITPRGAINQLHRLNLKLLCPRPKPAKADEEKKVKFKASLEHTIRNMNSQDHLLYFDAATIQHSATKTRKWGECGHQPTLPIIGGRKKLHIVGAIEPVGDKGWFAECSTLGAKEFIGFLKGLMRCYPMGNLNVVLDNARAHHAKRVADFVSLHNRINLLYLPPYSPDLNPIEDFWRVLRRNVTHNTFYATFDEFREAIIEYLARFKVPTGNIASLASRYLGMTEHQSTEVKV